MLLILSYTRAMMYRCMQLQTTALSNKHYRGGATDTTEFCAHFGIILQVVCIEISAKNA